MKVELIDNMGNDLSVIRATTASFAKDPVEWDEKKHPRLINYLARGMTQADYDLFIEKVAYGQFNEYEAEKLLNDYRHTPTHWSPHAQKEIQDLAEMVGEIIEPLYPHSWKALVRS